MCLLITGLYFAAGRTRIKLIYNSKNLLDSIYEDMHLVNVKISKPYSMHPFKQDKSVHVAYMYRKTELQCPFAAMKWRVRF